jgi:hypothetical protein
VKIRRWSSRGCSDADEGRGTSQPQAITGKHMCMRPQLHRQKSRRDLDGLEGHDAVLFARSNTFSVVPKRIIVEGAWRCSSTSPPVPSTSTSATTTITTTTHDCAKEVATRTLASISTHHVHTHPALTLIFCVLNNVALTTKFLCC